MVGINKIVKETADKKLTAKYRRKIQNRENMQVEEPWVSERLNESIKERKRYNKLRRHAKIRGGEG